MEAAHIVDWQGNMAPLISVEFCVGGRSLVSMIQLQHTCVGCLQNGVIHKAAQWYGESAPMCALRCCLADRRLGYQWPFAQLSKLTRSARPRNHAITYLSCHLFWIALLWNSLGSEPGTKSLAEKSSFCSSPKKKAQRWEVNGHASKTLNNYEWASY